MKKHDHDDAVYRELSRRRLVTTWGPAAAATVALASAGLALHERPGRHRPPDDAALPSPPDWRTVPDAPGRLALHGGAGPEQNLLAALGALGGIGAFIKPGDKVVLKPNCAWDRRPAQAANTDPTLVGAVVRLCREAGAASVIVADHSCHDPDRVFDRSGIGAAAAANGATVAHQNNSGVRLLDLGGSALGPWEVLQPIAEADRVINIPVVKHHSLSRVTLGMKNWMGAVVGPRAGMHQRIAQICAELAAAFRPTLTIIDATRILTGGGPTGGSLALVREADLIAVSTDQVAADAWGGSLLGHAPTELPHLAIAERLGLGTSQWSSIQVEG